MPWTTHDIPDLTDRTFVVTGANSGIGYEAARALLRKGGTVVLACRNLEKAEVALSKIRETQPKAKAQIIRLDLSSLKSVKEFADEFKEQHESLDVLINNAGVMALPRTETADGFEMQIGTNHLGHFALTGHLLERLLKGKHARVVTVSSQAHRVGRINFNDLMGKRRYNKVNAYGQAKLANLLFTHELQRRLENVGADVIATACHPGYAATNLQGVGARMEGNKLLERITQIGNSIIAQSAEDGALPTLYAATASGVRGGDYFGPAGAFEMTGPPKRIRPSRRARDADTAARLWGVSEDLTKVRYTALTN